MPLRLPVPRMRAADGEPLNLNERSEAADSTRGVFEYARTMDRRLPRRHNAVPQRPVAQYTLHAAPPRRDDRRRNPRPDPAGHGRRELLARMWREAGPPASDGR